MTSPLLSLERPCLGKRSADNGKSCLCGPEVAEKLTLTSIMFELVQGEMAFVRDLEIIDTVRAYT
jgi:hypothetical protein